MIHPTLFCAVHRLRVSAWRQLTIVIVAGILLVHLGGLGALAAHAMPGGQLAPIPAVSWSCRGVYYTVQRGETIYTIAWRYGTTAYRIAVCNGLSSYTVYVGQILLVPLSSFR
jgi:hypothetical protein